MAQRFFAFPVGSDVSFVYKGKLIYAKVSGFKQGFPPLYEFLVRDPKAQGLTAAERLIKLTTDECKDSGLKLATPPAGL